MKTLNAQRAVALITADSTPYTVKSCLTHWMQTYGKELPEYIEMLNSVLDEVET